jgi:hypothetical protein
MSLHTWRTDTVAAYARGVVAHADTKPAAGPATPVIGTLHEGLLHADLKRVIALPGDRFEQPVDGFVIDVVREGLLIEIQTGAFSPMRKKLEQLLATHRVRVVAPVARARTVVRLSRDGAMLGRRTSPKKGRVEEVFERLTGIAPLLAHENLELELVITKETELRAHEHGRVWRRKGWVIQGRALEDVFERRLLRGPADLAALLPVLLDAPFSTADLAKSAAMPRALAQQMLYCLAHAGAVQRVGKSGNAHLYRRA